MVFRQALLTLALYIVLPMLSVAQTWVVADAETGAPLSKASVLDKNGNVLRVSDKNGIVRNVSAEFYPLTIRYMGYEDKTVTQPPKGKVLLERKIRILRETLVDSKQRKLLHILAYARDYSTLTSYTDTVRMFREKMIDFMLPVDDKPIKVKWTTPRILNSRSYYHFTNDSGLDSVSDRCQYYFTWSDWVSVPPHFRLRENLYNRTSGTDTVFGRHSPAEIWTKHDDKLNISIDLLSDSTERRWLPNIAWYFNKDDVDFEVMKLNLNYDNIVTSNVEPTDLSDFSLEIESRGRGRGMFMFNRSDLPVFVTTHSEVYILDKEFITVKEARKWEKRDFDPSRLLIIEPESAPPLQRSILTLIDRVSRIDAAQIRLERVPDQRLVGRNVIRHTPNLGQRAFTILKMMTGISRIKSKRNREKQWKKFRDEWRSKNKLDSLPPPF